MNTHAQRFEARVDELVADGVYKSKGAARRALVASGDRDALIDKQRAAHNAAGKPFWFDRIEAGFAGISPTLPV